MGHLRKPPGLLQDRGGRCLQQDVAHWTWKLLHTTHSSCVCWCKTTAVKILAQSGEELIKSIQSSDAIGEWWLWWRKNLFSFGHFLKGYPSFIDCPASPQPGSTKFIQNEHMHMKLGGKVTGYGQGLKGRECRMDLVKTQCIHLQNPQKVIYYKMG